MEEVLQQILVSITTLTENQQRFETKLDNIGQRLDRVEARLTSVEQKVDRVEARLTSVEQKVDQVEARLTSVENRLTTSEQKLDLVYAQTAILTEFRAQTIQKLDQLTKGQEKILYDIEILAGEQGKQKLEIERLKLRPV